MGSSFVLLDISMEITRRAVSVREKRLHTKTSLPVGKRYLPMGKKASVTTTIIRTLIQAIKQIQLIVQQSSVLLRG